MVLPWSPRGEKLRRKGGGCTNRCLVLGGYFYEGNKSFLCATKQPITLSGMTIKLNLNLNLTVNILSVVTFSSLLLYVQYPEQPVCTSLFFTLLFIKSQYTVFHFLYILLFFAHLVVFLHIFFAHLIVFCTSYCFLHILLFCTFFYFIAHFTLISPFLTICMPLCCVTLYNLYSYYFALSTERTWFDYISLLIIPCITYYVTNKETLNLDLERLILFKQGFLLWSWS